MVDEQGIPIQVIILLLDCFAGSQWRPICSSEKCVGKIPSQLCSAW